MAQERRAQTTKIGGGADYAKVAERLKLFREDCPYGKHESAYDVDVDGTIVFTVWLWKDKTDLMDLMKAGVVDRDALRSSADANGNAKSSSTLMKENNESKVQGKFKEKEFEKLESIALGRALANLGYLASGEIASSEEIEEYEKWRAEQAEKEAAEFIAKIKVTTKQIELNTLLASNRDALKNRLIVEAIKEKQAEFANAKKVEETTDGKNS